MTRANLFLTLFVLAGSIELLALSMGLTLVHQVAKPLIVLFLIGNYLSSTPSRDRRFLRALFFCWTGDVLLLFQGEGEMFFMLGLLAFLAGHALYISSYRRFRWKDKTNELLPTQKMRYSFPIILAGTGLLVILFPSLGPLTIPVLIYSIVLMLMVMTAVFRFGRTSPDSFWLVLLGAILFMASDSLLAINKFHSPFELSGPIVMLTYILAQYLIVEGVLRHELRGKSVDLV